MKKQALRFHKNQKKGQKPKTQHLSSSEKADDWSDPLHPCSCSNGKPWKPARSRRRRCRKFFSAVFRFESDKNETVSFCLKTVLLRVCGFSQPLDCVAGATRTTLAFSFFENAQFKSFRLHNATIFLHLHLDSKTTR